MRVVHVSPSVLAAAPSMLSDALEDYGWVASSIHFRGGDHRSERAATAPSSIGLYDTPEDRELFLHYYVQSDVVHVHNFVPFFMLAWMASAGTKEKKFVYQVHSPRYERPVYDDVAESHGIEFAEKLAVCHCQPRQFAEFTMMPNCLYRRHYVHPPSTQRSSGALVVDYSPSNNSSGRFGGKTSSEFVRAFDRLRSDDRFVVREFVGVQPEKLSLARAKADITIDEVVTGSYHLVSYEGLAVGSVVVNGADDLSVAIFRMGFKSPAPPFVRTSARDLVSTLSDLANDTDALAARRRSSREFFERWMHPRRTSEMYRDLYSGGHS